MREYKKGEYRDQFVIAYITDFDDCEDIILWSKKFCHLLNKGLILLHISDEKYTTINTIEAEKNLKILNDKISLPYIHSYAALSGKTKEIISNSGNLLNGVMIISKVNTKANKRNPIATESIIKNFYTSRIAYFIFKDFNDHNIFKNVVLSMNALKECKEKILWASYFGRFAHSITHIYYHRYRDEYLQKQLNLNIGFLRNMFKKFHIETLNARSMDRRTLLDVQALRYAEKNSCDICIFQTTKNKSYIELFTGLSERIVMNSINNVPVLFLNQRDDLFVMCE